MIYKNCEIVLLTEKNQWRALVIRGVTLDDVKSTESYSKREEAVEAAKALIDDFE